MESSKEELSNIFTINNFIKIRTDILYKQYLAFKYNSDHIAIRLVKKELWDSKEYMIAILISEYNFLIKQMLMPNGQSSEKNLLKNNSSCDLCVFIYSSFLKGIFT